MNKWVIVASLGLGLLFGCGALTPPSDRLSKAEIDAVFDLQEIGVFGTAADGAPLLGGKRFDPADIQGKTYGRKHNLLDLSEDALAALPKVVRDNALMASPDEIRVFLRENGLTVGDVNRFRATDGQIGLIGLLQLQRLTSARTQGNSVLSKLSLKGGQ